ncbi:MAG: uL15 family ribosomal protein [Candidatus Methanoperedens sp.]|jgi:large subunit ribosomal protein L15|nr:uL15 family ribosomal protein [Candidatus Methanoperedens sp.]PKL54434.1 MAG: 50S ribosomal protein L15 [Candidatus Methanoperedenaceae archaeon HGW-Methanoperedenaceae-1]
MAKQKTKKFRGSRTCGGGIAKNRRGGGSRGGRGNAGGCKHHFVRNYKKGIVYGKHGFTRPPAITSDKVIVNVGEIDEAIEQLVLDGVAEKNGEEYHINLADLGIEKVLGTGKVTKPLFVTAGEFSASAKQKLEDAAGNAIELSEKTETPEVAE